MPSLCYKLYLGKKKARQKVVGTLTRFGFCSYVLASNKNKHVVEIESDFFFVTGGKKSHPRPIQGTGTSPEVEGPLPLCLGLAHSSPRPCWPWSFFDCVWIGMCVCVCVCLCICDHSLHICPPHHCCYSVIQDNLWKSVCSFNIAGSKDQEQAVRPSHWCLYPLCYCAGPNLI